LWFHFVLLKISECGEDILGCNLVELCNVNQTLHVVNVVGGNLQVMLGI